MFRRASTKPVFVPVLVGLGNKGNVREDGGRRSAPSQEDVPKELPAAMGAVQMEKVDKTRASMGKEGRHGTHVAPLGVRVRR
jgi:hypothetical protein